MSMHTQDTAPLRFAPPGNYLDFERATLQRGEEKSAEIADLLPFAPAIIRLEEDRVQMRPQEPRGSAAIVADVGEQAASIQADLETRLASEEITVCVAGKAASFHFDNCASLPRRILYRTRRVGRDGQVKFRISGRRASNAVGELRRALASWNDYYAEWHPEFGWWLREPFTTTDSLLEKYQRFLREEVAREVETARSGMFLSSRC